MACCFVIAAAIVCTLQLNDEKELPKARFDLYELKTLTAAAGDIDVALSWETIRTPVLMNILLAGLRALQGAEGGQIFPSEAIPVQLSVIL